MADTIKLRAMSAFGLLILLALAWVMSENRRKVPLRIILWGLTLQVLLGLLVLRTDFGLWFFTQVRVAFDTLTGATKAGAGFLFGKLTESQDIGAIMAFQVLPVIIFVSSVAAILQHLHIIQGVVRALAFVMRRTMKTSGAETFGAALLVFLGIESLAAVRAYLNNMTRSELFTIMTAFMATIAASVMVAYASFGAEPGHLLAASLMSAPAAILVAKIMIPETAVPLTNGNTHVTIPIQSHNIVDAATRGASDGLHLALNVAAMLIAFLGIVHLLNLATAATTGHNFQELLGWLFRPFAYLMGVAPQDTANVAQLLGTRSAFNEFLAYVQFKELLAAGTISPRSAVIATYALCGFANPGSVGILIGGATALMPHRQKEIVQLALKSFISGTLACFITGCMAGILTNG